MDPPYEEFMGTGSVIAVRLPWRTRTGAKLQGVNCRESIAAWLLPTDSPGQRTVQTWDQMTDERESEQPPGQ